MKIVFIGGRDIHTLGGIESYMYNLSHKLVELGHQPIVYCESDKNEIVYEDGVKIIYLKGYKSNLICKPWVGLKATIRTVFCEKGVDFIHYNAWPPSMWSFIPRLLGKKTLLQEHGFEWRHTKYTSFQVRILKCMEEITAYTNTHIICVSNEQTEYFKKYYKRKATTIPTAVNLPVSNNSMSSNILKKFNLTKNKYFLFLGRLSKEKNVAQLIDAFYNISGYKLVIAGTNTIEPEYVDDLKKRSTNSNIIFTGAVYGDDKECLLRNAYAFCLPSTVEGLSIALLEAMSYHIPIIASNIQANKEVLGDNAVFVRPEDVTDLTTAIEYCIEHKDILDSFVGKNYEKVQEAYTWDKVAQKYQNYLYSILERQISG